MWRPLSGSCSRLAGPPATWLCAATLAAVLVGVAVAPRAEAAFGYLGKFGSAGAGAGQFFDPYGMDADPGGNLLVADTGNYRIQKLHADGAPFDPPVMWGGQGTGDGQFSKPYDVAVDGLGNVYVADGWRGGPDIANERVQKFDGNGTFVTKWGERGPGSGQFQGMSGIAAHTDTSVDPPVTYVYTAEPNRVQKFGADGTFLGQWGGEGFGPGQFRDLWDVGVDAAGTVYTIESDGGGAGGNHRVQRFDKDGNFLSQFDVGSSGQCWRRLAVESAGFVAVVPECVGGGNPLKRFNPAGELVDTITCSGPFGGFIGADRAGKVYLDGRNNGLFAFGEGGGACDPPSPPPPPPPGGGGGGSGPGGSTGLVFSGSEGVTINSGAQFTNDPAVELTIAPPGAASAVRLSNDGGFLGAGDRSLEPSGRYAWVLAETGQERLPKTVYVRFSGPGGSSPLTFSDDIILDQTAPTVSSASLSGDGAGVAVASAAKARARRYALRIKARDNASGVDRLQLATSRSRPGQLRRFKRRLTFRARSAPRYVRVRDRAGNYSKWRRLGASR